MLCITRPGSSAAPPTRSSTSPDVDLVARKPENISHLDAASLSRRRNGLGGPGDASSTHRRGNDPHHGGAGGVGTIAIQVARAIGARVITTAKAGDHEFVRSLGADPAIDYASMDYVDAVADMTQGKGVDVVFDTIGGDTLTRSPVIGATLPLARMGEAHESLENRGKVVIDVAGDTVALPSHVS